MNKVTVTLIDVEGRVFEAQGLTIVREGWMKYYPFLKPSESLIPMLSRGESVKIEDVNIKVTWSKPSTKITKDSLLRWMESVEIGTESTRARIIETLYRRGI
jgi:DNA topoisomerase-1